MSEALAKAEELIKTQKEAFDAVNEYFAPYIEIEKRVLKLKSWADHDEIDRDYYFDVDDDNSDIYGFSFTTGQYEKWGEYQTGYLTIRRELLSDPEGYEARKLEEHRKAQAIKANDDKQKAALRLEGAKKNWEDARAAYEKLNG